MDIERRRVGRPAGNDPRQKAVLTKFNKKEQWHLEFLMKEYDMSAQDVIRFCVSEHFYIASQ